ncbi:MAG: hypothetical protein AVDCRST_MAG90-844 [uncultured Microvirga sp.]|uniref:Uncharacterized protein n=1 Tax=uncultured Microvirga sp. TaxID=412392 RepID=A0A6J4L000_9HYPH|nr:MAG: hypothetical protein AVDCRST_MAG90-844 [uncultured Microvirga sp.]
MAMMMTMAPTSQIKLFTNVSQAQASLGSQRQSRGPVPAHEPGLAGRASAPIRPRCVQAQFSAAG